jgi:HEAT repeat protein
MACRSPLPPPLTTLIRGDFETRWRALQTLMPQAQPAYLSCLEAACQAAPTDWQLQWFTARLCGAWQSPEALVTLRTLANLASEPETQTTIWQAIAHQGESGLALLQQALEDPLQRGLAIAAIARSEQPLALALLFDLVQSKTTSLRAQILTALGPLREPRVLPCLREALQDPDAAVRQAAIWGLRQQSTCTPTERLQLLQTRLYDSDAEVAREASWAIAQLDSPEATQALAQSLTDLSALSHPQGVIQALAALSCPAALEPLALLLQANADLALARSTIRALGSCPQQHGATRLLLARLGQQAAELADLAYSLGQLGQPEAIAPLQACLAEASAAAVIHIHSALRRLRAEC